MIKNKKSYVLLFLSIVACFVTGFFTVKINTPQINEDVVCAAVAQVTDDYYCIRDEHALIVEDQSSFGTCWAFSGLKVIESAIATKTGVLYDFSQAWVTVCKKIENSHYQIGDGGNFFNMVSLIQKYGLVLEEDFPYEALYYTDVDNYQELYNYYSKYAIKSIADNLKVKYIFDRSFTVSEQLHKAKEYLITNGALYTAVNWNCAKQVDYIYYVNSYKDVDYSGHAITIIGWDDKIVFTDKKGNEQTGAFICQNSWGADSNEIIYVSYNDAYLLTDVEGVQYDGASDFELEITSTTSKFKNYNKGQFDSVPTQVTQTYYYEQNLFMVGEDILINYDYQIRNDSQETKVFVDIFKNYQSQQNVFKITVKQNYSSFSVENIANIDSGKYIIEIKVDYENDSEIDLIYKSPIYVYSGAGFCCVRGGCQQATYFVYQSYNTIVDENGYNLYGFTSLNYSIYRLKLSTFSTVASVKYGTNVAYHSHSTFVPATNSSYSKGEIFVQINNINNYKKYENYIILKLLDNSEYRINLITYKLSSNDKPAYIFTNFEQQFTNGNYVAVGENYPNITLDINIDKGKPIEGFYFDRRLTQKVQNNMLTESDFTTILCQNHALKNRNITYLILYVKTNELMDIVFDSYTLKSVSYGDKVDIDIIPAMYGSEDFTYTLINGVIPNGLILNINTLKLSGTVLDRGHFALTIKATDNVNGKFKTAIISLTVYRRQIEYTVDNKTSVYGDPYVSFTGSITDGSLYGNDDLNITFKVQEIEEGYELTVGHYTIYGFSQNDMYDIYFITGTYTITPRPINITWLKTEFDYTGEVWFPEYTISGVVNGDTVNITRNGQQLNAGEYTATLTTTNKNYQLVNNTVTFKINKIKAGLENISVKANQYMSIEYLSDVALPEYYSWVNKNEKVLRGTHYYQAVYTPENPNYEGGVVTVELNYGKTQISTELFIIVFALEVIMLLYIALIIMAKLKRKKIAVKKQMLEQQRYFDQVTIRFITNSPNMLDSITSTQNIKIDLPMPERQYFKFKGWYTDPICRTPYQNNGNAKVLILYAKWEIE